MDPEQSRSNLEAEMGAPLARAFMQAAATIGHSAPEAFAAGQVAGAAATLSLVGAQHKSCTTLALAVEWYRQNGCRVSFARKRLHSLSRDNA